MIKNRDTIEWTQREHNLNRRKRRKKYKPYTPTYAPAGHQPCKFLRPVSKDAAELSKSLGWSSGTCVPDKPFSAECLHLCVCGGRVCV